MPVSGRPVKAALLKITQGSSPPAVDGLQNSARGPAAGRDASEVADDASARLRVQSKLPRTTKEAVRQPSKMITATRHCTGTAGAAGAGAGGGPLGSLTTMGSLAPSVA